MMLTEAVGLVIGWTKINAAALALCAMYSASKLLTGPSVEKHRSIIPDAEMFFHFLLSHILVPMHNQVAGNVSSFCAFVKGCERPKITTYPALK